MGPGVGYPSKGGWRVKGRGWRVVGGEKGFNGWG